MVQQLHTLIPVRDAVRARRTERLTALHRESQKVDLYEGLTRSYQPRDDDGERLPNENKNVQVNADTMLNELVDTLARSWNIEATIDASNTGARADVRVPTGETTTDGQVVYRTIAESVLATTLLFAARQLDDVYTFVKKLPTLDPAVNWTYDENVAASVGEPVTTHRSKKVLKNHVKWEPTPGNDRHPAQVETFTEDVVVGDWTLVRRSGALPLERKARLLQRIDALRLAVKDARERANEAPVVNVELARPMFDYLLGD